MINEETRRKLREINLGEAIKGWRYSRRILRQ